VISDGFLAMETVVLGIESYLDVHVCSLLPVIGTWSSGCETCFGRRRKNIIELPERVLSIDLVDGKVWWWHVIVRIVCQRGGAETEKRQENDNAHGDRLLGVKGQRPPAINRGIVAAPANTG